MTLFTLTYDQSVFLVILLGSLLLLITQKVRSDLVAVFIVISLYASKVLSPDEAVSGFSSEPALVIAGVFVLTGALHVTGFSDSLGALIGRATGKSYNRMISIIMPSVSILSAFTHHVTTTAIMLPVTMNLSREHDIPSSKLLMPLAFAASLGTTITIIGAPAFLLADSTLRQAGSQGLGIFSIAPIGLALSALGTLYVLTIGRALLPDRNGAEQSVEHFKLHEYLTEIVLLEGSALIGKTVEQIEKEQPYKISIIGWIRDGAKRVSKSRPLQSGDVLLVRTTPEDMIAIRKESGVELHPIHRYGEQTEKSTDEHEESDHQFVQVVVAPRSELIRKTIGEIDVLSRYGAVIVGLWRKSGWLGQELSKVRLQSGDVLVLQGDKESFARIGQDRAFLMFLPFHAETVMKRKAPLAAGIMIATILAAALSIFSIEMAALTGAALVVLTGCITARQAYSAIDSRIFVFIAGVIPLGFAMQKTGVSLLFANSMKGIVEGWPPFWILFALFGVVAVFTQFMSDAATTALFAPIAASLASALDLNPQAFVVTVAMASVTAFLTPIGHHGNLLIYGPGGYRFTDFVKVGAPLTLLVAVTVVVLSQILWPV